MVDQAVDRALEGRRASVAAEVGRLVEATLGLIQQTGDIEPRVSQIVKAAGVSNQAFYKHFRSKHELLVAVLDEGVRLLAGYLNHRMQLAGTPSERVREWIRGVCEQALDPQAAEATRPFVLARARLAESFPEEVARSEAQLTSLVQQALVEAVASGELPGADPERDGAALYLLTMGWVQSQLTRGAPARPDDANPLESFAMAGLARPVATATASPAATGA